MNRARHNTTDRLVQVVAKVYEGALFMAQSGATATAPDGSEYRCSVGIPSSEPLIAMPGPGHRTVRFDWNALVHAAIEAVKTPPRRDEVAACSRCGGMRIEHESWVDTNRNKPTDRDSGDDTWCPRCSEHVRVLRLRRFADSDAWHEASDRERYVYRSLRAAIRSLRSHDRPEVGPEPSDPNGYGSRWAVAQPKDAP